MDPRTRTLRRIRLEDAARASQVFELLMGDDVPPRRRFIIDNAEDFDRSNIDA
jgi:DNA gyrase subunit B